MADNFGALDPATYFLRAAGVEHGHFVADTGGCTWLIRSDGELVNWYTTKERIRWGGGAENYGQAGTWEAGPGHLHPSGVQNPIPSTMPIRFRSRGACLDGGM